MSVLDENAGGAGEPGAVTKPRVRSLWRNRDYLLLWWGQAISSTGSQISEFAFPLFALVITGSPALMGLVASLRFFSYMLLSLPAGALIDRWNRKRVMIVCDTGRAVCLASIPFALLVGQPSVVQLTVLIGLVSVLEGMFYVFFNIAETACLPRIILQEQLDTAVSLNETTLNTSYMLGPFLGGFLFGVKRALPFFVDAVSYGVSVLSLLSIRGAFQGERDSAPRALLVEIREGLAWLWHNRLVRFIALVSCMANSIDAGIIALIIVIATGQHASPFTIGVIFTAVGIGGTLGAFAAGPLQKRFGFGQLFPVNQLILALLVPLYLVASFNLILLGIVTTCFFFVDTIHNVVAFTYRLSLIPDELQGRVNSVFRLIAFAGGPLGLLLVGTLLQTTAIIPTVLVLMTIIGIITISTLLNPNIRKAPPLHEVCGVTEQKSGLS